jgi:omega-6 fatty acid desaturase (delta-12 desaturase)
LQRTLLETRTGSQGAHRRRALQQRRADRRRFVELLNRPLYNFWAVRDGRDWQWPPVVDPDVEVVDDPSLMQDGDDPQLERAIHEVLERLEANPPKRPAGPACPNRSGRQTARHLTAAGRIPRKLEPRLLEELALMESPACVPRPAARAEWRDIVAPYQQPSVGRSVAQLAVTLVALAGSFVAMYLAMRVSALLALALSVVAAGFLVRTFIIMHDCGHGSFFRSRRANDLVGFVTGALTLTPYAQWAKDHAIHHATSGRLDKRGYGDIETLTVGEYVALSRLGRLKYRLYRNAAVLLVLGPVWLVLKQRVHTPGSAGRREIVGVHLTNATVLLMLAAASLLVGPKAVAAIYAPTVFIAAAAGIWLFYVQHQYGRTYWASGEDWDYATAAVAGSSFYRLPRVLDWMTGSIGFHHVHHLSPRIPNYYLRRAHEENPYFQRAHRLTLRESLHAFSLKLWDEERGRMVGWAELGGPRPKGAG